MMSRSAQEEEYNHIPVSSEQLADSLVQSGDAITELFQDFSGMPKNGDEMKPAHHLELQRDNRNSIVHTPEQQQGQKMVNGWNQARTQYDEEASRPRPRGIESVAVAIAAVPIILEYGKKALEMIKTSKELFNEGKSGIKLLKGLFFATKEDKRIKELKKEVEQLEKHEKKLAEIRALEARLAQLRLSNADPDESTRQRVGAVLGLSDEHEIAALPHDTHSLSQTVQDEIPRQQAALHAQMVTVSGGMSNALFGNGNSPTPALQLAHN